MRPASGGPDRTLARAHCHARLATRRWRGGSAPLRSMRTACPGRGRRDAPRAAFGLPGLGGGSGRVWRLSLPGRRRGAKFGKRVVTGAKCGLRASGGKGIAKNFSSEALVTGWYGAATTGLPPAAWSADADVGAARRNQVPLSRSIAMSRGQTPRPRHDGPLRIGGGLAQAKRRGGCRTGPHGPVRRPGNPPGIDDASEPWRVALQAGPGMLTPWPCGRSATLESAARRNRARGHCRTTGTPQPPLWSAA